MPDDPIITAAGLGASIFVFHLLALAAYRITRFLVDDTLIGFNPRSETPTSVALNRWARTPDGDDRKWGRGRIADLLVCTYCLGFHVCWILTCVWFRHWPWQLGYDGWLYAVALAGFQALLNATDHRLNS